MEASFMQPFPGLAAVAVVVGRKKASTMKRKAGARRAPPSFPGQLASGTPRDMDFCRTIAEIHILWKMRTADVRGNMYAALLCWMERAHRYSYWMERAHWYSYSTECAHRFQRLRESAHRSPCLRKSAHRLWHCHLRTASKTGVLAQKRISCYCRSCWHINDSGY